MEGDLIERPEAREVGWREALGVWLRIAVHSFGGPAGQIAVMHRLLVGQTRWISERRFLHALSYCMLLPGPEAQQLATYTGWLLKRTWGGLVAGTLFILPGFLSILVLSYLYARHRELTIVAGMFAGLKPAVLALVLVALYRIGRRAFTGAAPVLIASASFLAIFVFDVPFPAIVIAAGAIGYLGSRTGFDGLFLADDSGPDATAGDGLIDRLIAEGRLTHTRPSIARAALVLVVGVGVWLGPLAVLSLFRGPDDTLVRIGAFFSKTAVVTFGGAYGVLAYVAQQAVATYGWLAPGEMIDGLGMAETTPGPLIQVVQFVGYLGAYRQPGALSPAAAGFLGAVVTTWATFVPSFVWIFAGAPYVEKLHDYRPIRAGLAAITAAVVGVILDLAVWFGLHSLFAVVRDVRFGPAYLPIPDWQTVSPASAAIAVLALAALTRFKVGVMPVILASAAAGALLFRVGWI